MKGEVIFESFSVCILVFVYHTVVRLGLRLTKIC